MIETTLKTFSNDESVSHILSSKTIEQGQNISHLINLVTNHSAYKNLENILGHQIIDKAKFVIALTHSSFHNENIQLVSTDYERLEFLGDSFIGLAFTDKLIKEFPDLSEGELSKMRACLVNGESLSQLAHVLKLDQLVLVGKGEVKNNGTLKKTILADVFEAIFGAIFIEAGFKNTIIILENLLQSYYEVYETPFICISKLETFDYKSKLQELTMKEYGLTPEYQEVIVSNHQNEFTFEIKLGDKVLLKTVALSKKKAKDNLAKKLYIQLNNEINILN